MTADAGYARKPANVATDGPRDVDEGGRRTRERNQGTTIPQRVVMV